MDEKNDPSGVKQKPVLNPTPPADGKPDNPPQDVPTEKPEPSSLSEPSTPGPTSPTAEQPSPPPSPAGGTDIPPPPSGTPAAPSPPLPPMPGEEPETPGPEKPKQEPPAPEEEPEEPGGGDGPAVSAEDLEDGTGLPPVITPPQKPKFPVKKLGGLVAVLLLLVSIPVGVFLLSRPPGTQDIRELAAGPGDCGASGFAGWGEDCDTGRGELVRVVICNDGRHLPNIPLRISCGAGDSRSISEVKQDQLINSCVKRDCDTINFSPGRYVCIEEWRRPDGNTYTKPGGVTADTCSAAGSVPPPDTSKDIRINECKKEECDRNNFNPGHLICMEEWRRPDGSTYLKPGRDTGKTCGTEPITNVSTSFSCTGSELDCTKTNCQGVSQPDCRATGGTVRSCSDNVVRCCYADGNCFSGQLPAGSPGGGCRNDGGGKVTLTGLKNKSVKVLRMDCPNQTSSTGACSENVKEETVTITGDSQSFTANGGCGGHQVDVVGYCGSYAFNGPCETKAEAAQVVTAPAPTGGPTFSSQCLNVKTFKGSTLLTADNFDEEVDPGDTITLTVAGTTNEPGGINKARFRVNGGSWNETTTKNDAGEFVYNFTVPSAGTFKFEAMIHNPLLGWR